MGESDQQMSPERYAIEQAISRIDAEKESLDSFMVHVKWIVSVVSSIVIVVVGFVSFLGISNLSEVSKQIADDARSRVRQAIQFDEENIADLAKLNAELKRAQSEYKENREAIDALKELKELASVDRQDPFFALESLQRFEEENATAANRGTALKLLANIIKAGEQAIADPNTLFNSSVIAARLEFHSESVKLAVLAEHWRPSIAHRALKAQATEVLGQSFRLDGDSLVQLDADPNEVRTTAWKTLLAMVKEAPRDESEQIYSRASNVAVRNSSAGYYRQLIDAIVTSEAERPDQLTSYAYATLANLYSWDGAPDWKQKHWSAVEKALIKVKGESPAVSWYPHTAEDLLKNAVRLDTYEQLFELSDSLGIPVKFWRAQMDNAIDDIAAQ